MTKHILKEVTYMPQIRFSCLFCVSRRCFWASGTKKKKDYGNKTKNDHNQFSVSITNQASKGCEDISIGTQVTNSQEKHLAPSLDHH